MLKVLFRNLIAVIALVVIGFIVTNYYGSLQQTVGVKGVNTHKAQEITEDLSTDVGDQIDGAAEKAGEVKVNDVVGFFQRFQKIPEDFNNMKSYVTEKVAHFRDR